jgi:CHAP domain
MTPEDIRFYQQTHKNHLGQPLKVDGTLGPQTRWSLDFDTIAEQRRDVITRAQTYIGLEENPPRSNDDPLKLISTWLKRCSAGSGEPWCAAFASHCLSVGARVIKQAGAINLGKHFPSTDEPRPGDLFWYPTGTSGHGHVGLIIGVGWYEVMTIEGNCENAVRCVRRELAGLRFARTSEDTSGRCPGVVPSAPAAPGGTR